MYEQIAKDIFEVLQITRTGVQCETRFKTLAKRKRSEDNHNRTSGNSRCQTSYEEEFNAIRAIDDSLEPEVSKHSTLDRSTAGPSSTAQDGNIDNSEGSEQDDASTRAPGGESRCKKRKADRGIRPSNSRMQHMVFFFEQMKALNDAKERKKEEREKRKEERHQELLQAHKAQMQTLRDLANKQ
ncbi:hypothetical protein HPB47_000951 [Ixodes persulcatus]|uniref:Uncharacterized protein n=1 Tax=Ixodes persulcatus TaxID=34615 RepID=A0AC60PR41_IXOPE|nr:hypothetical protein HPB47_000951 [Ixodes persulcatus]